ncbi:MAG: DNA mismatch repair endonuclease MutL [Alphaproteobacteria bacterium]
MTIRRLPSGLVNRIAAGEVVERPAAVVKELVENALDAGAQRIDVSLGEGGRTLVAVADDGRGMTADDLTLAIERHATSKLPDDDLVHIGSLGFRGEALPSIGAVARLTLTSRPKDADTAWLIRVEGGDVTGPEPASRAHGTTVEARDIFFATPARLKFLRNPRSESQACIEVMRRLALARADVAFSLEDDGRKVLALPAAPGGLIDARLDRATQVIGRDFGKNALVIEAEREGARLLGHASAPGYDRANGLAQHFFVNGRPVRDPVLLGAARAAYADILPRGRFPALALFLELSAETVDVNVHPAKTEVRFRESGMIRGLVISALKHALAGAGFGQTATVSDAALGAWQMPNRPSLAASQRGYAFHEPMANPGLATFPPSARAEPEAPSPDVMAHPLGAARAQLHANYIVAQTTGGMVLVDQHAAHERLVYERLKAARAAGDIPRQIMLIPEVVELDAATAAGLIVESTALAELGLVIEAFGPGAILVRETPAALGEPDVQALIRDLADEVQDVGGAEPLSERLDAIAATIACHGSVRSGRRLNQMEMDALLREMEATPNSGRCNHGRPTYIELDLADIERLFHRR